MRIKRVFAMLICAALTLCFAALPLTVHAANATTVTIGTATLSSASGYYYHNGPSGAQGYVDNVAADYNAFFNTSTTPPTLTLNGLNISTGETKAITINGDMAIVMRSGSSRAVSTAVSGDSCGIYCLGALTVSGSGSLSVTSGTSTTDDTCGIYVNDGLAISGGTLNATGESSSGGSSYGVNVNNGSLTASGGTLNAESKGSSGGGSFGVRASGITASGGTINATGGTASGDYHNSFGLYSVTAITLISGKLTGPGGSTTGDIFSSSVGVQALGGSATVSGGTLEGTGGAVTGGNDSYGVHMIPSGGSVTVSGGTLKATGGASTSGDSFGVYAPSGSVTVSGGTLESTGGSTAGTSYGVAANVAISFNSGAATAKGNTQALMSAATLGAGVTAEASADITGSTGIEAYDDSKNNTYLYFRTPATVAAPTFSPAAGSYDSPQSVTLSCATAGATIRYTTDGSEPTETSTIYNAGTPISVVKTTTIYAKAFKTNMTQSASASAAYTIPAPPIAISPSASFVKGSAPANMMINVGEAGKAPNLASHFGSLEISINGADFTPLTENSEFTLSYGSIHMALSQTYLNSLPAGTHTLRVNLAGAYAGMSLTATFTVTTAGGGSSSSARANPSTGV